jgi:hypothetical protein
MWRLCSCVPHSFSLSRKHSGVVSEQLIDSFFSCQSFVTQSTLSWSRHPKSRGTCSARQLHCTASKSTASGKVPTRLSARLAQRKEKGGGDDHSFLSCLGEVVKGAHKITGQANAPRRTTPGRSRNAKGYRTRVLLFQEETSAASVMQSARLRFRTQAFRGRLCGDGGFQISACVRK